MCYNHSHGFLENHDMLCVFKQAIWRNIADLAVKVAMWLEGVWQVAGLGLWSWRSLDIWHGWVCGDGEGVWVGGWWRWLINCCKYPFLTSWISVEITPIITHLKEIGCASCCFIPCARNIVVHGLNYMFFCTNKFKQCLLYSELYYAICLRWYDLMEYLALPFKN